MVQGCWEDTFAHTWGFHPKVVGATLETMPWVSQGLGLSEKVETHSKHPRLARDTIHNLNRLDLNENRKQELGQCNV